jgi:hypothetical protein
VIILPIAGMTAWYERRGLPNLKTTQTLDQHKLFEIGVPNRLIANFKVYCWKVISCCPLKLELWTPHRAKASHRLLVSWQFSAIWTDSHISETKFVMQPERHNDEGYTAGCENARDQRLCVRFRALVTIQINIFEYTSIYQWKDIPNLHLIHAYVRRRCQNWRIKLCRLAQLSQSPTEIDRESNSSLDRWTVSLGWNNESAK